MPLNTYFTDDDVLPPKKKKPPSWKDGLASPLRRDPSGKSIPTAPDRPLPTSTSIVPPPIVTPNAPPPTVKTKTRTPTKPWHEKFDPPDPRFGVTPAPVAPAPKPVANPLAPTGTAIVPPPPQIQAPTLGAGGPQVQPTTQAPAAPLIDYANRIGDRQKELIRKQYLNPAYDKSDDLAYIAGLRQEKALQERANMPAPRVLTPEQRAQKGREVDQMALDVLEARAAAPPTQPWSPQKVADDYWNQPKFSPSELDDAMIGQKNPLVWREQRAAGERAGNYRTRVEELFSRPEDLDKIAEIKARMADPNAYAQAPATSPTPADRYWKAARDDATARLVQQRGAREQVEGTRLTLENIDQTTEVAKRRAEQAVYEEAAKHGGMTPEQRVADAIATSKLDDVARQQEKARLDEPYIAQNEAKERLAQAHAGAKRTASSVANHIKALNGVMMTSDDEYARYAALQDAYSAFSPLPDELKPSVADETLAMLEADGVFTVKPAIGSSILGRGVKAIGMAINPAMSGGLTKETLIANAAKDTSLQNIIENLRFYRKFN